jgi:hypothetical protein
MSKGRRVMAVAVFLMFNVIVNGILDNPVIDSNTKSKMVFKEIWNLFRSLKRVFRNEVY